MEQEVATNFWAIVALIVTVVIFIITHVVSAVWVMSALKTQVSNVVHAIDELKENIKGFVPRKEINESLKRVWQEIENIKEIIRSNK